MPVFAIFCPYVQRNERGGINFIKNFKDTPLKSKFAFLGFFQYALIKKAPHFCRASAVILAAFLFEFKFYLSSL